MADRHSIETRLIHAGEPRPRIQGAVTMPIFQTAMYEDDGTNDYHDVRYIRLNNTPNHHALHEKLASLEGAEAALVTASGMAAISTALLSVLSTGDHLIAQDNLYGGTHALMLHDFPALGIEVDLVDAAAPDTWAAQVRPNTRVIYVETLTNPLVRIGELDRVPAFAREHGLVSMIDNTFASPIQFRPAEHGFDVSLHSCTKYLNGHSDIVAGAAIGGREAIERVKRRLDHLGGTLDPHAAFLLQRGMKTLSLRVRQQAATALELARFLEGHPGVSQVHYPGLESHPGHDRAARLLDGFGGMLSFELSGGVEAADRFMERVEIPLVAPSLGGVESLVTRPATTSHSGMTPEERAQAGVSDALVRVSVGIESTDDLLADFRRALG